MLPSLGPENTSLQRKLMERAVEQEEQGNEVEEDEDEDDDEEVEEKEAEEVEEKEADEVERRKRSRRVTEMDFYRIGKGGEELKGE
ncbi:uncharacterized protein PV06_08299 [Exophiala oligosperma]|uniref:Uncharacterized protein n=1 Tax=Exophiala oligosperma TaxID=215243 RepID=A0A0D2DB60_9EURO|nr:uncharacterized protein PV06_08299 [Exophiala oligosperma]KIW39710.1 hypothetical protein PV06_08299 [Exophiala oligosperma]